jgi:hypothetical protein
MTKATATATTTRGVTATPSVPLVVTNSYAVTVLAQIPVMAWIRPSAMALTKVS